MAAMPPFEGAASLPGEPNTNLSGYHPSELNLTGDAIPAPGNGQVSESLGALGSAGVPLEDVRPDILPPAARGATGQYEADPAVSREDTDQARLFSGTAEALHAEPEEAVSLPLDVPQEGRGETVSREYLSQECARTVDREVDLVHSRVRSGETVPEEQRRTAAEVMLSRAHTAARAESLADVESAVRGAIDLARENTKIVAEACYAGVAAGSEEAASYLHQCLTAEGNRAGLLDAVISECEQAGVEQTGVSAEVWIQKYEADADNRRSLTLGHYRRMAERDAPDSGLYRERFEAVAASLLDEGADPYKICHDIASHVDAVSDPTLREQLLNRFMNRAPKTGAYVETFRDVMTLGKKLISDPNLGSKYALNWCGIVSDYLYHAQDGRMAPNVVKEHAGWMLAQEKHRGAGPDQLIGQLNKFIAKIDAQDTADSGLSMELRDSVLGECATDYAREGDFDAARQCIGGMVGEENRLGMLTRCLYIAETAEQRQQLRPDELTALAHPEQDMKWRLVEAGRTGTPDELAQVAREAVQGHMATNPSVRYGVEAVFARMAKLDAPGAIVLGKEIIDRLHAAGERYEVRAGFTRGLVRLGDTGEAVRAYNELLRNGPGYSPDVHHLWELQTLLRQQ
jgi:hypothetical protein